VVKESPKRGRDFDGVSGPAGGRKKIFRPR